MKIKKGVNMTFSPRNIRIFLFSKDFSPKFRIYRMIYAIIDVAIFILGVDCDSTDVYKIARLFKKK